MALAGLGAFHGINPAMGWLFAVALGLQEKTARAVVAALVPIGLGHVLSVAVAVAAVALLRSWVDPRALAIGSAALLVGFGLHRLTARHAARAGMRIGFSGLLAWSFLMATGHGAGVMLLPVLLRMPMEAREGSHHASHFPSEGEASTALLAVLVHSTAMLVAAGAVALAVYNTVGLAFLRRGWINLDLIWAGALIVAALGSIAPLL
jgi:hypothetical protein